MNVPALRKMTANEFVLWAEAQERGRYELVDGMVVEMNAERSIHALVKLNCAFQLRQSLAKSGLQGRVYGDGIAVQIAHRLVHEPDAMVRLGPPLPDDAILITDPVIVVEVLSPSTGPIDTGTKLVNYFKLPSVVHYLVVNTTDRVVLHYRRGADMEPAMTLVRAGDITLDPPGLTVAVAALFE